MKDLLNIVHLILCQKGHAKDVMEITERKDSICYFYLENDIADGETMGDHLYWSKATEKFKIAMGLKGDQQTMDFIRECLKLSHQVHSITEGQEGRKEFIKSLLNF